MSTQPSAYPQPYPPAQAGVLLPPALDLTTPGEPAQYRVPDAYRRPYGELVRDKRGRGYYPAVMALTAGVVSWIVVLMAGVFALLALIPALAAIVLGIRALYMRGRNLRTHLHGKTAGLAWGGIVLGAICIPVAVLFYFMASWLLNGAEVANCEMTYAGDEEAIARCIEKNTRY
ncbi:MAG: hypothetical protein SPI83_06635 [Rothia sp. (in: high G+C Gram-positive bacteria)]|nr:hypothetical protein [Rothia sp. (in: high G+C Gram-positive bacteria)]